jgi:hypothetical protein
MPVERERSVVATKQKEKNKQTNKQTAVLQQTLESFMGFGRW